MLFPNPIYSEGFLVDSFNYIDKVTYGGLGIVLLVVIFAILFLMMNAFGTDRAFATSSFITCFFGILFRFLFMKNDYVVYVSIILFVISLFILKNSNDPI